MSNAKLMSQDEVFGTPNEKAEVGCGSKYLPLLKELDARVRRDSAIEMDWAAR